MLDHRFTWLVAESGYTWLRTDETPGGDFTKPSRPGRFLIWDWGNHEPPPARSYSPFEESGLHRTFAKLEPAEAAIASFANTYGMLSGELQTTVGQPLEGKSGTTVFVPGETLKGWTAEIGAMNHLTGLWDHARAGDHEWLREFLVWEPPVKGSQEARVLYRGGAHRPSFLIPESDDLRAFRQFHQGSLTLPAMYALQHLLNLKLLQHRASSLLTWTKDKRESRLRMRPWPVTLIAALWIQFAYAVDGNLDYRQCEVCPKSFELTGGRREDAKYCSQACRFRAYRSRQRKARELHLQKKSFVEIARVLDTTVEKVKGWITK